MLDKKQPFNTMLGTKVDGVCFTQGKNAYDNSGTYLGEMKEGKLVKREVKKAATKKASK